MTAAYNAAWYHLWIAGVVVTPHQVGILKRKLTQVILASACTGARNRERLMDIALRALGVPTAVTKPCSKLPEGPPDFDAALRGQTASL